MKHDFEVVLKLQIIIDDYWRETKEVSEAWNKMMKATMTVLVLSHSVVSHSL